MIPDLSFNDLQAIFDGDQRNAFAREYPIYPFTAPGMPPPGPNFIAHAKALGDDDPVRANKQKQIEEVGFRLKCLYLRCLYDNNFELPVVVKGRTEQARVIPGHYWGYTANGPAILDEKDLNGRSRVMVIGKHPGLEELQQGRNLVGASGDLLRTTLNKLGVPEEESNWWYVCNLVRWQHLDPQGGALPRAWVKDCLPLLHQEFRFVRPDYVLCLGAEAIKHVCGPRYTLSSMIGRYVTVTVPLEDFGEDPQPHDMKVMAVTHPAAVLRATERYPQFEATLKNFVQLTRGEEFTSKTNDDITIQPIYKERELRELVDHIIAHPGIKKIAVDGEWHGNHPGDTGAYLRTIQISHHGQYAAVIVLRHRGGEPAFKPSRAAAIAQLRRLLDRDDVQIGGSFFSSDLPWLVHEGLDIRHRFTVPATPEEMYKGAYAGGFDVALALHAVNETADFKLEVMASRSCGAPRWDIHLQQWKKDYCAQHKLKDEELEGYGECPDDILIPYGGKDAAYTRQLMDRHAEMLNADMYNNDCWVPFHISMSAFQAFNEMGMVGVKVDPKRIDDLTDLFQTIRVSKIKKLQDDIKWPNFNPRSAQQCVEFLFGERYSTKRDPETGDRVSVRPPGAIALYLQPVKSTSGRPWGWVAARGDTDKYSPSTDKEVLGILGLRDPRAFALRDVRLIDQVLKSVFRLPKVEKDGTIIIDELGRRIYQGGIGKYICEDSRVRSSFQQVKETGRASSARPPLHNISKRREDDYQRILGDQYAWPIRSFITSNTDQDYGEPTVLLEADYKGAELFGMAVMSRDTQMIDHCLRANVEEDDPDFYDIHSNVAVAAFQLKCPPTKKGLSESGQKGKRVSAKNIIFGVGYGRTAEACARQCQEEGAPISELEAQQIIDTIFTLYPGIPVLQETLRGRVHDPGWLRNCFGRMRRFMRTSDKAAMGELERQALNFPFQSMVADAVSLALRHLYTHPRRAELGYRIVLTIHDAIVLEVPTRSVDTVYDEIMEECMVNRISFRACDPDGIPFADSPEYRFGIDKDVQTRWGVRLSWDECDALGIDRRYGKKKAA